MVEVPHLTRLTDHDDNIFRAFQHITFLEPLSLFSTRLVRITLLNCLLSTTFISTCTPYRCSSELLRSFPQFLRNHGQPVIR
jgi:hypothetical protein